MPALLQAEIAEGISQRSGSLIPTTAINIKSL
jgi:hypothetical protein